MRDLLPTLATLVLPPIGAPTAPGPSPLADVPGLVSDIERRFAALEAHCAAVGDVSDDDVEFYRLDDLVTAAIRALADTPSRDAAGMVAKAGALLRAPIKEDDERSDRVASSLARDVLAILGCQIDKQGATVTRRGQT